MVLSWLYFNTPCYFEEKCYQLNFCEIYIPRKYFSLNTTLIKVTGDKINRWIALIVARPTATVFTIFLTLKPFMRMI